MTENGVSESNRSHEKDSKAKVYSCFECSKSFPTYQALGGHMSTHSGRKNFIRRGWTSDFKMNGQPVDLMYFPLNPAIRTSTSVFSGETSSVSTVRSYLVGESPLIELPLSSVMENMPIEMEKEAVSCELKLGVLADTSGLDLTLRL